MRARQRWSKNNSLSQLCNGEIFDDADDGDDGDEDD